MSDSLRELSLRQFAEGVSVDGILIDAVMADVVQLWNNLPPRLLAARLKENRLVGGYDPASARSQLPWLRCFNWDVPAERVSSPAREVENVWRAKGFAQAGIDPTQTSGLESVLLWEVARAFVEPVILDSLSIIMGADGFYPNTWVWGATPPPGKSVGEPVDDFFVEVSVANRFLNTVRRLDDVGVHRVRFRITADAMTQLSLAGAADTMLPPHPEGVPCMTAGRADTIWPAIDLQRVLLPIPANSIVRVKFGIPLYDGANISGWGGPAAWPPTNSQTYSWSMGILEEVQ